MAAPSALDGSEILSKKRSYKLCRNEFLETFLKMYKKNRNFLKDVIRHELGIFSENTRVEECRLNRIEDIGTIKAKRLSQQMLFYGKGK